MQEVHYGIPITEFPVAMTDRGVDAKTWGVEHLFKRSFGIKGRGLMGLRARISEERYPIRRLLGPALPKEIVKDRTAESFVQSVERFVPAAITKRIKQSMESGR